MDTSNTDQRRPIWRRGLAATGRVSFTLIVIAAATGAGVAGFSTLSARALDVEAPSAAPLTSVAPRILRIETSITVPRRFTGQFEAAQAVGLGFEEGGTIKEVTVREGDTVAAGALLARADTRVLDAERTRLVASRDALAAQAELARRTYERQAALLADGHATRQRIDETSLLVTQLSASVAEVEAAISLVDVRLEKAEIRAPFAGRIGLRRLDQGAVAGPGEAVVTLLEDAPARFRVALAPALTDQLTPGDTVEIDVDGSRVSARLSELAPELDPATRSRMAFFDLDSADLMPPSGTAGSLILQETRSEAGAWIPLAALRQGPRGAWTLLTVEEDDNGQALIRQEAAELLHVDEERAFVRGTFGDGALYLPGGLHRVVPGEAVSVAETQG